MPSDYPDDISVVSISVPSWGESEYRIYADGTFVDPEFKGGGQSGNGLVDITIQSPPDLPGTTKPLSEESNKIGKHYLRVAAGIIEQM